MPLSPKKKGLIVLIVFISIMILPVTYAFIRERLLKQNNVKQANPQEQRDSTQAK